MKRIGIIIAISLVGAIYTRAQCTLAYKALSTFKNDTTAFMKYNFADRAACYKGKTVNDVLNDLTASKIPTKSYAYNIKMDRSTNGISVLTFMQIYMYDRNLKLKRNTERLNGNFQKINAIKIIFETPIDFESNKSMFLNNNNLELTTAIKNFFAPKKIKEVKFIE